MSLDNAVTAGELRAALDGIPDDEPVMVLVDGANAAWLAQVRHDTDARTFDLLAGRGVEFGPEGAAVTGWPVLAERRPS